MNKHVRRSSLSVGGNLLIMIALLSMQYAVGQEGAPTAPQSSESAFREVYNKIKGLRKQKLPWAEKLKIFNKAVDWLEKSRDCLSGRGCSKKQAYLANFALGGAIGLGKSLLRLGFQVVDQRVTLLDFIATELGYRYLVKEKVQLWRCLTFRGCSDQTKRYLLFNLGQSAGGISGLILMPGKAAEWKKKSEKAQRESLGKMLGLPAEEESGEKEEAAGPSVVESVPVEAPFVLSEPVGQGDVD